MILSKKLQLVLCITEIKVATSEGDCWNIKPGNAIALVKIVAGAIPWLSNG